MNHDGQASIFIRPINKHTSEYFTRGNSNKLLVKRCRYELRKNFFSNQIVNMWNSLPDYVVMSDTINTFKNRLDAHWKHREF